MTACDEHACMHAWHAVIDLSGTSRVVYAMFEIQSCVRGHHVYKDIWAPFVGETLSCEREEDNTADPYNYVQFVPTWLIFTGSVTYVAISLQQNFHITNSSIPLMNGFEH